MCPSDVFITEFVNTDGMFSEGKTLFLRLSFTEDERPLIAQSLGIHPEAYYLAAKEIVDLGLMG